MKPLFSIEQIRHIETDSAIEANILMRRAAQAISLWLQRQLQAGERVLFLAGAGNNGGDALTAAFMLAAAQPDVTIEIWLTALPEQCTPLTQQAYSKLQQAHYPNIATKIITSEHELPSTRAADWIVDGLFGIGLSKPITSIPATLVSIANDLALQGTRILAIDLPSGLDANHGNTSSSTQPNETPPVVIRAHHTLTMIGLKPGLYTSYGRDYAGEIHLAKLDIPETFYPTPQAYLNDPEFFQAALPQRPHSGHKGNYGKLAILGGAHGMIGAPLLSGRAALLSGAGKITIGLLATSNPMVDWLYPELMLTSATDLDLNKFQALLIGPGMGQATHDLIAAALQQTTPCIIDADALNQIADSDELLEKLYQRKNKHYATILTPHPLEAARLLCSDVASIQSARLESAKMLANKTGATIVLKGSGTVICETDQPILINPTGNGALATAGTGDVLAGVIAALVAQGMSGYLAASASVWLHGQAADDLVITGHGPIGLNASALAMAIRARLNQINLFVLN